MQEQKYISDAENAWEQAWDILHEEKGWALEAGVEPCKGCVYARKFKKLGKIFRLEVSKKCIIVITVELVIFDRTLWKKAPNFGHRQQVVVNGRFHFNKRNLTPNLQVLYNFMTI